MMKNKKKSVGIITILKVNNYGAELQAYATQKVMNLMGYDAEIIDYLFYRNVGHHKERCSLPFYPYPFKNRIKEWILRLMDRIESMLMGDSVKIRMDNFSSFHKEFTRFSAKQYKRYSELFDDPPQYDAYCVGSDQVWNPRCYTNLNPYFLKFAPRHSAKFSYASSFGVKEVPKSAEFQYATNLNNLSCLSVREQAGADIVKTLTGRDAELVADPTLLLSRSEWAEVEKPLDGIPQKYVLVYELHQIDKIMETARFIAKHINCKIVRICKNTLSGKKADDVINIVEAGPSEFIYLFNHAVAIVTNSFHGTAFSINFRKNFYCVLSKKATNNSRQLSLLNLCGMEDRIVYDDYPLPNWNHFQIDYQVANQAIEHLKNKSMNYIRRAIDGTTEK